jgi:hypothetical protein
MSRLGIESNAPCLTAGDADWAVDVWRRIEGILIPVVGSTVVAFFYEKSLAAANATYPWLPSAIRLPDEPPVMDLNDLRRVLAMLSSVEAIGGVALMLHSFGLLLEKLVGKGLASRMLQSVLPRGTPAAWRCTAPREMQASIHTSH